MAMTSRLSATAPILAALAIVLVTLGAYVGGYYGLGEYSELRCEWEKPITHRVYRNAWYCHIFTPLARVESKVSGREVRLLSDEPAYNLEIFSTLEDN
jgi:hypothetical protein